MSESSITCPDCGRTSHHPDDVREGYCGACHWWTSDPVLGPARRPAHTGDEPPPVVIG